MTEKMIYRYDNCPECENDIILRISQKYKFYVWVCSNKVDHKKRFFNFYTKNHHHIIRLLWATLWPPGASVWPASPLRVHVSY